MAIAFAGPASAHFSFFWHTHEADPIVEAVPYTGTTHLVQLTGKGVFPEETFANDGDRILFVNRSSNSDGVRGTNSEWNSGTLYRNQGYLLLVQPGVQKNFKMHRNSYVEGRVRGQTLPEQLMPDPEVPPIATVLSLVGLSLNILTGLLDDLGLVDDLLPL